MSLPPFRPEDFDYSLPPERIAQTAVEPRDAARLLVVHRQNGRIEHRNFRDLPEYLTPKDALVLNQTRVIPARLQARKVPSGGAVEILLAQKLADERWLALLGGKRLKVGTQLQLEGAPELMAEICEAREGAQRVIQFNAPIEPYLDRIGELPLPPYIHQKLSDPERYQTVYARVEGSAAAPTAGLHFTPELLLRIRAMGVSIVYCTLHVGLGTFLPLREEQIAARRLHAEYAELSAEAAEQLNEVKLRGGRIFAVGTTTVRTLETAALYALGTPPEQLHLAGYQPAESCPWRPLSAFSAQTELFIMPTFKFRAVDALITNFHLPKSSLLMLVSAFSSRELILQAYQVAIQEGYRFYSLGDAMLIL
ncbi:MAG: tRNA preQ1(34) S-adenosylmethionine ribosyltransferase-isomerase QueA [Candidatus Thermofonsia Clade 1 bacterium]|jgi:S-adenosylmethionine:tRNA ribosyltransferase-isomerase|uniref:S-adenosylmethionine:tRNA ribosyltransferase-isomerase n=1 Tax=Candidatus Thermofonsia Clade 1 bacterium TaxID=2364210 RepID=A0A2M8PE03_9CHLR|nr:MAG: tRNA preQ1(34) S-adenosylmethionine ribosyltransferase-isomerase QueA [Candidatus Thermofonsia Clade 1 bacterium]